ncbi:MAG: hypothetical protein EPO21_11165 [Chloroflexota bacterium]|nr:MAG: hypothetical protein EPO21_11165 [Chloroflexota bacterium]
MNLVKYLEQHAARHPDRIGLYFEDRTWTYAQVDATMSRIASGLRGLGLQKGDRVAVMLPNWPEFHFCTHAAWKLGAVEVPINTMYREEETSFILGNAEASVVFAFPEAARMIQGVRTELPSLKAVVAVGGDAPAGTMPFDELLAQGDPVCLAPEMDPDDLAAIAYTSGTTGFPKGAMLSHYNLIISIQRMRDYLGLSERDNVMQALPCFHSNASLIGMILAWFLGSSAILVERIESRKFLETVSRTRPAMFASVPTILYDILHLPGEDVESAFSSVRYVVFGAAPTGPELRRRIEERFGLKVLQSYGMTEAPNSVTFDPLVGRPNLDSVGLPMEHLTIKIVDEDDNALPIGEVGEICIGPRTDGPHAGLFKPMQGYWKSLEASISALKGGFYHTGDMGKLDEDGFLYVVDRKKDMIIRGGNNIFSAELERVLRTDERVEEVYVVGVPHERLGQVPKAYVVLKPGADAREEELKELIAARLARYKRLEHVEFVTRESLPRNALGKVLKRELTARELAAYRVGH